MGSFEYYYDPTVQVGKREQVATSYGASDPCEDFAEYTPFFFKAPDVAIDLSMEKFLYYNQLVGGHYSDEAVSQLAAERGFSKEDVLKTSAVVQRKMKEAPRLAGLRSA